MGVWLLLLWLAHHIWSRFFPDLCISDDHVPDSVAGAGHGSACSADASWVLLFAAAAAAAVRGGWGGAGHVSTPNCTPLGREVAVEVGHHTVISAAQTLVLHFSLLCNED